MFEKYLNEEVIAPIYDITNLAYPARSTKFIVMFGGLQLVSLPLFYVLGYWLIPVHLAISFIPSRLYYRFCRDFVEKIDYDSKENAFKLTQRTLLGSFRHNTVPV
jgi:hypothetical protein